MAFLHDDALYGETQARLLDMAQFLYAIILQQGGMIVLPPKEELERITSNLVLGFNVDERTGNVILTVVPKDEQ